MSTNKATVEALLDGIARRDAALLATLVTPDAVWWAPVSAARLGLERPLRGRAGVVQLLSGVSNFYREGTTTWTVLALVEEGPTVIAHVRRQCLTGGGQPYDNEYLLRFDFAPDGLIREAWEHTDTSYAQELLLSERKQSS